MIHFLDTINFHRYPEVVKYVEEKFPEVDAAYHLAIRKAEEAARFRDTYRNSVTLDGAVVLYSTLEDCWQHFFACQRTITDPLVQLVIKDGRGNELRRLTLNDPYERVETELQLVNSL